MSCLGSRNALILCFLWIFTQAKVFLFAQICKEESQFTGYLIFVVLSLIIFFRELLRFFILAFCSYCFTEAVEVMGSTYFLWLCLFLSVSLVVFGRPSNDDPGRSQLIGAHLPLHFTVT